MSEPNKAERSISERVTLIGQPEIKSGTISSGPRAGQPYHFVQMKAYKSNVVTNEAGQTTKLPPTYYNLTIWGNEAKTKELAATLKPQMKAEISGNAKEHAYTDKNGEQKTGFNVNVKSIVPEIQKQQTQSVAAERPQLQAQQAQLQANAPMRNQATGKGFER